jgi:Ca-activated chloride channel homolog
MVLAVVLLSSVGAAALQPPETRIDPQGRPIISIHADLVVLHVTVLYRRKGYIAGLPQDAFTVYEDGQPQPVTFFKNEDTPVTVGLVIDNSGSMQSKRDGVIAAGLAFARSSNPDDEMFTVNFNEFVSTGLPNGVGFTSDVTALHSALGRIGANGRTAIYDAIAFALDHLDGGTRQKRVLIVVSDGSDNASRVTFETVMAQAQSSNAVIYTVGLFERYDSDANPKVLKALASSTGGQAFFPDDPADARHVLERIASDIRSGYTIGYTPTNSERDGKYRRIRVLVRAPGHGAVTVHTRPGYQAPAPGTDRFEP